MAIELRPRDEAEAPAGRGERPERDPAHDAIWATVREVVRKMGQERRGDGRSRPPRPREGWRG